MRYLLKLAFCCVVFSLCLLIPVGAIKLKDFQYKGLIHPNVFSPDGNNQVMIVENRYPGGSVFSLRLWVMGKKGTQRYGMHALTPIYQEVVAVPGGNNISFVEFDTTRGYSVHILMPDTLEAHRDLAYESRPIEQLQFSKDGQHYCFFLSFKPHPFESLKEKMKEKVASVLQPSGWIIYEKKGDFIQNKNGDLIFSQKEKEAFTQWAPIKKTKVLSQFFTQPMPKITLETQVHWSPDSKKIYVLDETGIWRVKPFPSYFPMWTKVVNAKRVLRFHLSQTGNEMLYEVAPDIADRGEAEIRNDPHGLENEIWLASLVPINVEKTLPKKSEAIAARGPVWQLDVTADISPQKFAKGWGAAFNPYGKSINYADLEGGNILNLETMESEHVEPTARVMFRF